MDRAPWAKAHERVVVEETVDPAYPIRQPKEQRLFFKEVMDNLWEWVWVTVLVRETAEADVKAV